MEELNLINVVILIGAGLLVLSAMTSLLAARLGVPLLLIFLCLGLLAGEDGPGGIDFDNTSIAFFVGSMALAIILFDAGFETPWRSWRLAAGPGVLLATAGVLVTAGIVGVAAHYALGVDWTTAFLLGAIVSSTDAAAVFLLLRLGGIHVRDRVRSTLEIESGANDPIAVFLTLGLAEVVRNPDVESLLAFAPNFLLQLGLGGLGGALGGWALALLVNRVRLEEGLYPLVMIGGALAIFGGLNLAGASGFLGVYVAGLVAGNVRLYGAPAIRRFQLGLSWLSQIGMFLALGLLATPSSFVEMLLPAGIVAGVLILLARPLAAWLCLLPFRFGRREVAFVAWVGLRGAVSILLAIVPLLSGHPDGQMLFNVAFIVVLVSLLVQGWSLRPAAKLLKQTVPFRQGPADRVELVLPGEQTVEMVVYTVREGSPVVRGQRLPRWARPALILREGREHDIHSARGLKPGDHLYLFTTPQKIPLLDKLFAHQVDLSPEDSEFYGDFILPGDTALERLAAEYDLQLPPTAEGETLASYFTDRLGELEVGDRLRLGPVELVVIEEVDGTPRQVGLVLDPPSERPPFLFLPTGPELMAWLKARLRRKSKALPAPPERPQLPAAAPTTADAPDAPPEKDAEST